MFNSTLVTGVLAGAAMMLSFTSPSFAALDKCSKLIDTEGKKAQTAVLTSFQKCHNWYRTDALKPPTTPPFSKAATNCEKELSKKVLAPLTGSIDKQISKLASKVDGKICTDADLIALGHLPTKAFGKNWAQFQGVAALQYAYEQQLIMTRDWLRILGDLGNTGLCPSCVKLNKAPCQEASCKLSGASTATVGLSVTSLAVTVKGANVLRFCEVSTLISSSPGVIYVMGGPGKTLKPADVLVNTACVKTLAAEGVVQCGTGPKKINYTSCQDHTATTTNVAGATTSGDCTGDVCLQTQTNAQAELVDPVEDANALHGGQCLTIDNSVGGVAGDAFINLSSQIGLAPPFDDCTDESKLVDRGLPQISPLTTGSGIVQVLHADTDKNHSSDVTIESDPISGTPFNCTQLAAGQMPSVKLVGAFPALNTLKLSTSSPDLSDSVTGFVLECEP